MNGLFGGTARTAAALLPQLKTAPATPPNAPRRRGLFSFDPKVSGQDRFMALSAMLADLGQGGTSNLQDLREQQRENAERSARNAAMAGLSQALSGSGGGEKGPMAPGAAMAQGGGIPTLRQAAPALLAAQQAGIDIGDYVSLLDRAGPDIAVENGQTYDRRGIGSGQRIGVNLQNVNGSMLDTQDPRNANRFVPDVGVGEELVYDQNGQPMVRNIQGSVQSGAYREAANVGAREAATAPYRFVNVPTPNGAPATMSVQAAAGQTFMGQAPADAAAANTYATTNAVNQAEAAETRRAAGSVASRMIPTLYSMEQRLPDVIAGVGSGYRRLGNQVLGALGNDDAQARVTATETFENEARQIVTQIIRSFGPNPTEGERRFAEQMSGADVNYTPEALAEGARLTRSRAARDIEAAGGTSEGLGDVVQDDSGRRLIWNGFDWVPL